MLDLTNKHKISFTPFFSKLSPRMFALILHSLGISADRGTYKARFKGKKALCPKVKIYVLLFTDYLLRLSS